MVDRVPDVERVLTAGPERPGTVSESAVWTVIERWAEKAGGAGWRVSDSPGVARFADFGTDHADSGIASGGEGTSCW